MPHRMIRNTVRDFLPGRWTPVNETRDTAFGFSADERLEYERALLRLLVATLVETYLEETGVQAQELAYRIHKSKSWISKLLSGSQNPTLDTLADVASALGVRWDVSLCAIDRAGTPAAADPPPPHWVTTPNRGLGDPE